MIGTSYSGAVIDYDTPSNTEVRDVDLRVQLSRLCRYSGAIEFSVLQHLALCSMLAAKYGPVVAAYAAAHDLHEAYTGDLIGPIKLQPSIRSNWVELEAKWEAHVHTSMGLPYPPPEQVADMVKSIDHRCLYVEVFTCDAHDTLVERLKSGPAVSAFEHDRCRLVRGMRPEALWKIVSEAIRAGRYALANPT